ncbi:MAG: transposase [Caldilineaceae bacterium]|nr:transposase [Caldilineaceae bacterium]
MSAELRIPLDIPDVEILKTEITKDNRVIIEIESTRETTECGICGQTIRCSYGHGQERILRHLPVLGMATYVKFRPRRAQCQSCEHEPTTTQVVEWYQERSPHTTAYDQWLMKQLINTTIEDVSMRENIGYDAVIGALDRQIETKVNWSEIDELGTVGIDEIAQQKGRNSYTAIVSCRQKNGQTRVLAVLPDRKKRQ